MSPPSLAPDEICEIEHDGRALPIEVWQAYGPKPASAVLVISEIFGLNDDIRRICHRLKSNGYTAAAPDLYRGGHWMKCAWRAIGGLQFKGGGRAANELQAAIEWLESRKDVREAGAIGFCMGGGFALLLGTRGTAKVAGGFYGTTPSFQKMQNHMCPVIAGYGNKDVAFAREGRKLKAALDELDVPNDIRHYDGVGHSFMSHQDPGLTTAAGRALMAVGYDEVAAEDSWTRMLAFFGEHLGAPSVL